MTDSEVYYPNRSNPMTKSEWIAVGDRLPGDNRNVLTYGEYGYVIAYRDIACNTWEPIWKDQETDTPYLLDCTISHWMPLPEPPGDAK